MNVPPRALNVLADWNHALRLAGFTPDAVQRILTEAARDAVNRLPTRPYPTYTERERTDSDGDESTCDRRS